MQSSSETTSCPGAWSEFSQYKPSWVLELWKSDGVEADSLVTSFCFRGADEECAPVPAEVLHDGEFSGPSGMSFIGMTFFAN